MVALSPDGGIYTGQVGDPDVYCMTARQIGEILAAAFVKTMESYTQALFVFVIIALVIGFSLGVAVMYARQRIIDAEERADESEEPEDPK